MRGVSSLRAAVLGLAAAWPFAAGGEIALRRGTDVLVLVLLGLSMTVTTGWLRTLAFHAPAAAAAGAMATSAVLGAGQALPVAVLLAAGAGVGVTILPTAAIARRHRALAPAVTLATTFAVWGVLLPTLRLSPFVRPVVLGIDLSSSRTLYLAALLLTGAAWLAIENLSASRVGRGARIVGADPRYALGTGVEPVPTWLAMFALSGALGGAGGSVLAVQAQGIPDAATASPAFAVVVVAVALLGGPRAPAGALLGALILGVVPALAPGPLDLQLVVAGLTVVAFALLPPVRGGLLDAVDLVAHRLRSRA